MILITGDTHGDQSRFSEDIAPFEYKLGKDDYLTILGDFGYIWTGSDKEKLFLDELSKRKYKILFIDGNHENFDLLNSFPTKKWNGGVVHQIRDNILHLTRGQIFTLNGKKIFTFGGGYSIDRMRRKEGVSWWPDELPTEEEYDEARKNLKAHNFKVDFILTHAAPAETMSMFTKDFYNEKELNVFLEWVREKTNPTYNHWYFGHMHQDEELWRRQTAIYCKIYNLETGKCLKKKN